MESEPLCDLPLAFEPTDTGLQVYALPATPHQITHLALTSSIFVRSASKFDCFDIKIYFRKIQIQLFLEFMFCEAAGMSSYGDKFNIKIF